MSTELVYLNGEILPLDQARVPVLDRGFIFGDGIYEVIPAYGGNLFRFAEHMQRLDNSLNAIGINNPMSHAEWEAVIKQVMQPLGQSDQSIYLQVTRGVAPRDHQFPVDVKPTVFVMSKPLHSVDPKLLHNGVSAITLDDIRWQYCYIKTIALLPNILQRQRAVEQGAAEAILIREGEVTEGAASNVFIVKDKTIKTPVKSECLLPGITRDLIVELAHDKGLSIEETAISEAELLNADEVWLSSSTKEILPITKLNDKPVGEGKPGPIWQQMYQIYQDYKQQLRQP